MTTTRMNPTRRLAAAAALALILGACASRQRLKLGATPGGEVVEAEGIVPNKPGDLPGTQAAALIAAERSAVEKVVGVYISAKAMTDKAQLVQDKVYANTAGYISKYDIESRGAQGEFYYTKIRALVLFQKIGQDLKAAGILDTGSIGNPRVAVLIDESADGQPWAGADGARGLTQAFLDRGYIVMERAAATDASSAAQVSAVDNGDAKAAADLGARLGVDVVVMGRDDASQFTPDQSLGGFLSYRARANLQAVRSGSGQVLATASRDASGLDATQAMAAGKALSQAASLAGEDLAGGLYDALQSRSEIVVALKGVRSVDELQKFQDELRTLAGVGTLALRSYTAGAAELSLIGASKGSDELAAFLTRMKSVNVEVDTYTSSRIEATLKD